MTFLQLRDAATAVLAREKSTSLAELFSVELKFTIDTLNNWFSNTIKPKFLELSDIRKRMFIKKNPIAPSKTTCCICWFLLNTEAFAEHLRWYDFIIEMEHLFLRNIFRKNKLEKIENLENIEYYSGCFEKFIELIPIVEGATGIPHRIKEKEKLENFMRDDLNDVFSHLGELKEAIDEVKVVKKFDKSPYIDKITCFIYSAVMDFCKTDKINGIPISEKFVDNVKGISYNKTHIHHSHITGDIIGYAHSYCNFKVRENKKKISVVAYNLFRFDFFFLLKGLRAGSWMTRDVSIGGKNPANIDFAYIGSFY